MSLGNDGGIPAVMNVTPTGNAGYNNGGGWGGDWGAWIILFLIFGMFGWGGMGGFGNFGGFGGGAYPTEAILQRSLDTQTIIGKLDGVTQGLCDGFYAQNNAINGVSTAVMQSAYQAELSRAQQQAALMQQLCNLGYQLKDCCCETQRSIDGVKFTIAQEDCATRNLMQSNTRDLIENQNANSRAILDALNQNYVRSLESENQSLKLAASQANQNATIGAMISASEATILRRTGAECPAPAYVVQPPTPVNFPTSCCGQFAGWGGNGCGGCNSGCGC